MAEEASPVKNLSADRGPHIIASMIALIILPTVFVVLRLTSRKIAHAGFWVAGQSSTFRQPLTDL